MREAEERLQAAGLEPDDAARVLAPAVTLQDDRGFWRRQEGGLALYAAPNFFRFHTVARPLRELCIVGDRFHVTQLLPVLAMDRPLYVLALSQKEVRLIEASVDLTTVVRSAHEGRVSELLVADGDER